MSSPSSTSEEWHTVRISISIYNEQTGSSILSTTETAGVDPNTKYVNFASCYTGIACDTIYDYCQSPNGNSTMQCVGYLYRNPNGCLELVIPVYSPYGFLSYQYYTLQNLPSSTPPIGTWAIRFWTNAHRLQFRPERSRLPRQLHHGKLIISIEARDRHPPCYVTNEPLRALRPMLKAIRSSLVR